MTGRARRVLLITRGFPFNDPPAFNALRVFAEAGWDAAAVHGPAQNVVATPPPAGVRSILVKPPSLRGTWRPLARGADWLGFRAQARMAVDRERPDVVISYL